MKKVMEVEKNMCFELASLEEHSVKQREHLEMGIIKCRENKDQLEDKLKKLMVNLKKGGQ